MCLFFLLWSSVHVCSSADHRWASASPTACLVHEAHTCQVLARALFPVTSRTMPTANTDLNIPIVASCRDLLWFFPRDPQQPLAFIVAMLRKPNRRLAPLTRALKCCMSHVQCMSVRTSIRTSTGKSMRVFASQAAGPPSMLYYQHVAITCML